MTPENPIRALLGSFQSRIMPLRQSTVFLFGLIPVVLILWAWVDSMHAFMDFRYCRSPLNQFWIQSENSKFSLGWHRAEALNPAPMVDGRPASAVFRFKGFTFTDAFGQVRRRPGETFPDTVWFERPGYIRNESLMVAALRKDVNRYLRVPYWLLLVCWLPPWILGSLWQLRRFRRAQAGPPIDPAPTGGDEARGV